MNLPEDKELDAIVAEALKEPVARPVPLGFRRRIKARLDLFKLIRGERRRLRASVVAVGALVLAYFVGALLLKAFPGMLAAFVRSIPGAQGYCDYLAASAYIPLPVLVVLVALLPVLPLGATLVSAFLPSRRNSHRR